MPEFVVESFICQDKNYHHTIESARKKLMKSPSVRNVSTEQYNLIKSLLSNEISQTLASLSFQKILKLLMRWTSIFSPH